MLKKYSNTLSPDHRINILSKLSGVLAVFSVFVLLSTVIAPHALADNLENPSASPNGMNGSGLAFNPFVITNCTDLQNVNNNTQAGIYYILGNDIDCSATTTWNSGNGFKPIGYADSFSGRIDGKGYTISNLYINCQVITNPSPRIGLFTTIAEGASVANLKLQNANYDATGCSDYFEVGGVAGTSNGTITDVSFNGDISVACPQNGYNSYVGGLVGKGLGANRASATGSITEVAQSCSGSVNIGGLYGTLHAGKQLKDSYSAMNIIAPACGNDCLAIGGLVGLLQNNNASPWILRSYAAGSIVMTEDPQVPLGYYVGGIVGYDGSTQTNNFEKVFSATAITAPNACNSNCNGPNRYANGIVGLTDNSPWNDYTEVYFDKTAVGLSACDNDAGNDAPTCNVVNINGNEPDYFKSNVNVPLSNWNFGTIWQETAGYPELQPIVNQYPDTVLSITPNILSATSVRFAYVFPSNTGSAGADPAKIDARVGVNTPVWYQTNPNTAQSTIDVNGVPLDSTVNARIVVVNEDGYWSAAGAASITTARPNSQLIRTCQELQGIEDDLAGTYELANDIDCSDAVNWNNGAGFRPIGDCNLQSPNVFVGILDGNNFAIRNLFIQPEFGQCKYTGLFGVSGAALIQDLKIINPTYLNITSGATGGISGVDVGSDIQNVHVEGADITGVDGAGGFIGFEIGLYGGYDAEISKSSFQGTVIGDQFIAEGGNGEQGYGGLIGTMYAIPSYTFTVLDNYVNADIIINNTNDTDYAAVGGAFGKIFGLYGDVDVQNTYAAGAIAVNIPDKPGMSMVFTGGVLWGSL